MSRRVEKIVVLDGRTLNPGDISWEPLSCLAGHFEVHARTLPQETVQRALGCRVLFTNKTPLGEAEFKALPGLEYVGVLATGYNVVDVGLARRLGITVTNVPSYGTMAVAQYAIGLLLEVTGQVGRHSQAVREGRWGSSRDFCFWDRPLMELDGKTLGIIGLGAIGRKVAAIAKSLGMSVLAYNGGRAKGCPEAGAAGLPELLGASDVISLHCPLTEETEGIIGSKTIPLMKDGVILVNTARGGLIDEGELAKALSSGKIAQAALDVLRDEPPLPGNPLIALPNCLITPHLAWSPPEARKRLIGTAASNLISFLDGAPVNVVNP
ncbi:MAG: D-2-hydroxyacid dehydrogenase [Deltaproteobacteria bacterium]|jgi:glycerate dehydrogenase|nr:D-2-hydroxyacid dehydrogenase [Deltaproteobacteria bacterium]